MIKDTIQHFDLAIAYKWEFDADLVYLIESIFQSGGLKTYIITPENLSSVYERIKRREINFTALLDRASDEDSAFEELPRILFRQGTYVINRYTDFVNKVIAKAPMHEILVKKGFDVPQTLIMKPFDKKSEVNIASAAIERLGQPFVVKPSYYSGAGEAVNLFAYSLNDIQNTRLLYSDDHFLVQEKIYPKYLDGRRAWFRVFYLFGKIIPVWWDDITHIFTIMFPEEIKHYRLKRLHLTMRKLSKLVKLDYFSTEITLSENNRFYLIDYVNEQCDFRFRSKFYDGAPEGIIIEFIYQMMAKVRGLQKNNPSSIVSRILR